MSKGAEKELTKLIPRIYKRNAENLMLFCWVNCARKYIPSISVQQAIWGYFQFFEIDSWDMESALSTYCKIQKEYFEDCKNENI